MNIPPDERAIELRDLRASLRHGGRWIAGGLVVGLALAVAILLFAPRRYKAETTVLLRDNPEAGSRLGGSSSGDGGISLGNLTELLSLGSAYDTEVEILTSRAVLERVADSLQLQARVTAPEVLPSWRVFESLSYPRNASAQTYEFELSGDAYRVTGDGRATQVGPGRTASIGALTFRLRDTRLPPRFAVRVAGMEETLDGLEKRLTVDKAGGDIAELTFRARDPLT
ncbi:MAG: Wzz/FepE/Etk N-terminal domain-containing protein, partial [Longimicrobiaceae bacterium]